MDAAGSQIFSKLSGTLGWTGQVEVYTEINICKASHIGTALYCTALHWHCLGFRGEIKSCIVVNVADF